MSDAPATLADVEKALAKLTEAGIRSTPILFSQAISTESKCQVYLKLENLQITGSYKVRGAYNMLSELEPAERKRGLITASAGNHAQGVAYAARRLGLTDNTTIVMAKSASEKKIARTRDYGVAVDLFGSSYDEAKHHAEELAKSRGLTYIPAFDHWQVIAGQGSVGLEILRDLPDVDVIVVPVGGGGLISGISIATQRHSRPIRVIGVEAEGAAPFAHSFRIGKRAAFPAPAHTIADGIQVQEPGVRTWSVVRALGSSAIVEVSDYFIAVAIGVLGDEQLIAEGAGAAGVAALLQGIIPDLTPVTKVAVVVSGGNIDRRKYDHYLRYVERPPGRIFEFRGMLDDVPGNLVNFLRPLVKEKINILSVDVLHWYPGSLADSNRKLVDVVVELSDDTDGEGIVTMMSAANYEIRGVPPHSEPTGPRPRETLTR